MSRAAVFAALLSLTLLSVAQARPDKPGLPRVLPRDLEIELALSAGPPHLRAGAAVYVLGEAGYELARPGTTASPASSSATSACRAGRTSSPRTATTPRA